MKNHILCKWLPSICASAPLRLSPSRTLACMFAILCQAAFAVDMTAGLEYLGKPATSRWGSDRTGENSVSDLQVYRDRIYLGSGDWDNNTGPVPIPEIDVATGKNRTRFFAGTDAIETLRVMEDGKLYVPSIDPHEASQIPNGDWFECDSDGNWSSHWRSGSGLNSSLAIHTWEIMLFDGWLFTGGYALAGSKNGGSWVNLSNGGITRATSFIRCGDELFARGSEYVEFQSNGTPNPRPRYYSAPFYTHWNKDAEDFEKVSCSWDDIAPGLTRSDLGMLTTNSVTAAPIGGWHATPFKDRCVYVLGTVGYLHPINNSHCYCAYPMIGVSAYAQNGAMKANKINVPRGTYPIDFTVSGDSVYMLTFRYKSDTQTVEHGVWKSADGANFTEIFTVDYQQTMISLEYHKGYFYFGVACKSAMPLIKPLQSGTSDMAGAVYRLWAPQEPVQVVASTGSVTVTEGGAAMSVSFTLSAQPATNMTLTVATTENARFSADRSQLTFTTSNWSTPQTVKVSLAGNSVLDELKEGRLVCGTAGDPARGALDGREVTPATVRLVPDDDENYAPVNGEIFTADDFYRAMMRPDGSYRMMNDIDISGSPFTTIDEFSGSFDGQGHVLTGLGEGPICRVSTGRFKGLTVDGGGSTNYHLRAGIFCGTARGGSFSNCTVRGYTMRSFGRTNVMGTFAGIADGGAVFAGCSSGSDCTLIHGNSVELDMGGLVGRIASANPSGVVAAFVDCTNNATLACNDCFNESYGKGGFVGQISNCYSASVPTIEFLRCVNNGAINVAKNIINAGGFVGVHKSASNKQSSSASIFTECVNNGAITATSADSVKGVAGAFIGRCPAAPCAEFYACVNRGPVDCPGMGTAGGFIGAWGGYFSNKGEGLKIVNSANYTNVSAMTYAGGLVGTISSNSGWANGKMQFLNCANYGVVSSTSTTNAEIVATVSSGTGNGVTEVFDNCWTTSGRLYWRSSKTPVETGNQNAATADQTALAALNAVAEANTNYLAWAIGPTTHPELVFSVEEPPIVEPVFHTVTFKSYDGSILKEELVEHGKSATAPEAPSRPGYTFTGWSAAFDSVTADLIIVAQYSENSYQGNLIHNAAEFIAAMANPSGSYRFAANIDLTGSGYVAAPEFSGTLDGYGFTLFGLGAQSVCTTNTGVIASLAIDGGGATNTLANSTTFGSVARFVDGGTVENVAVRNYTLKTGTQCTVGLVAGVLLNGGVIRGCTAEESSVLLQKQSSGAGGIVGKFDRTSAFAPVDSESNATTGVAVATVESCTNLADIVTYGTGNSAIGGLVGSAGVFDSTYRFTMVISNCVNAGAIYSTANNGGCNVGGFVGSRSFSMSGRGGVMIIADCANLGDISLHGTGGNIGGFVGYFYRGIATTAIRCVNRGELGAIPPALSGTDFSASTKQHTGGFYGHVESLYNQNPVFARDCANYGKVNGVSHAGGFTGYVTVNTGHTDTRCAFTNCANYAAVTGTRSDAFTGQIFGYFATATSTASSRVYGAVNCFFPDDNWYGYNAGSVIVTNGNVTAADAGYAASSAVSTLSGFASANGYETWILGDSGYPELAIFATPPSDNLLPELASGASAASVNAAILGSGLADSANVLAGIGGDLAKYNAFRTWAYAAGGSATVAGSPRAWQSYLVSRLLATPKVLFADATIMISSIVVTADNCTFTVRAREGDADLELAADANIYRSVIRESPAIGTGADWRNPGTGDTVTAVREGQNGVRVTVGRGESAAGFYKLTLE